MKLAVVGAATVALGSRADTLSSATARLLVVLLAELRDVALTSMLPPCSA